MKNFLQAIELLDDEGEDQEAVADDDPENHNNN
jgi:hypothetical protein